MKFAILKRAAFAAALSLSGVALAQTRPTPDDGTQYCVFEIFLNATPDRAAEAQAALRRMMEQLQQGTPFEYLARTYSESDTRATGGDMGCLRVTGLPAAFARLIRTTPAGTVAGPVALPGGYAIVYLAEVRPPAR